MIKIQDYHLIQNIDTLFELPIIILGAGHRGSRICMLLQDALFKVEYIYDAKFSEGSNYKGVQAISMDEVEDISKKEYYLIIIGTELHERDVIDELSQREIDGFICTWYGVQTAIELNIGDERFIGQFRQNFLEEKRVILESLKYSCLNNRFYKTYKYPEAVWVWQPRKVGSTTISKSLDNVNVPNIHMHELMTLKDNSEYDYFWKPHIDYLQTSFNKSQRPLKIITLVREPIGRALSDFFQYFTEMAVELDIDCCIKENAENFIINDLKSNYEFEWFNKEIKELTRIDIYKYPFDSDTGYAWIKEEKCELLILKLEQLKNNIEILRDFVENENISLENINIGSEKHYKHIYKEIKNNFQIPKKIVEEYYLNNALFSHFYTIDERKAFLMRYDNNLK